MFPLRRFSAALGAGLAVAWCLAGPRPPCLAAGWADVRTAGPFVCRADFRLDGLDGLDGLLQQLVQLQEELVRCLGIPPAQEPVELYLFHDQPTYARYLKQYYPKVSYRRALYIKSGGPGRVFAYQSRELGVDLRHECTHALLHAALPMVPLWLDEGLAEYFELPGPQRAFDNPHMDSLRWTLRFGMVPKIATLEKKGELAEMGQAEYRDSWAWVHFMFHGPAEAHDELVRHLAAIHASSPPGQLSRRLEARLPDLQRRFVAHFKGWKR